MQVRNNYPLTGQIAHCNESLRYLNEEIVYQIDGTPDVQVNRNPLSAGPGDKFNLVHVQSQFLLFLKSAIPNKEENYL